MLELKPWPSARAANDLNYCAILPVRPYFSVLTANFSIYSLIHLKILSESPSHVCRCARSEGYKVSKKMLFLLLGSS